MREVDHQLERLVVVGLQRQNHVIDQQVAVRLPDPGGDTEKHWYHLPPLSRSASLLDIRQKQVGLLYGLQKQARFKQASHSSVPYANANWITMPCRSSDVKTGDEESAIQIRSLWRLRS